MSYTPYTLNPSKMAYRARIKKQAPPNCEMCNASLPTFADREAHVAETKHCACPKCKRYIPPGFVYDHWSVMHNDLVWNDHHIASGDASTLREALPWVRAAYQANRPSINVDQWLGLQEQTVNLQTTGGRHENVEHEGTSGAEQVAGGEEEKDKEIGER